MKRPAGKWATSPYTTRRPIIKDSQLALCSQARFRADLESIIESHSVVHRAPAELWEDGLYLGNGNIAAMVHGGPERTRILLNKGDIWDERAAWLDQMYDPADFDWQRTREVLTKAIETGDWSEYYALL